MEKYLKEHCLDINNLPEEIVVHKKENKIEIKVKDLQNKYSFSKWRIFNNPKNKYLYDTGSSMQLFNGHLLKDGKNKDIWIVEGEFDCIALQNHLGNDHDIVVSSTGGVGSWKEEWTDLILSYISKSDDGRCEVFVLFDNDKAGKLGVVNRFKDFVQHTNRFSVVFLPDRYNDVCEALSDGYILKGDFTLDGDFDALLYMFRAFYEKKTKVGINRIVNYINTEITDNILRNALLDVSIGMWKDNFSKKQKFLIEDSSKESIDQIKQIPISSLIKFNSGNMAQCIFHQDKNPSMFYNDFSSKYPNTVKCYSCGKFADVIDVIMELENLSFKEVLNLNSLKHNN
jgi:hypothetical protein